MRRSLPGPFARLWRRPLRIGAIGLLVLTALASAGVQSAAAAALQSTLDENWRGLYDIVVTPAGGVHAIDGMLPPNTLAASGEGLSLDDLARVRGVAGVDLAAPIGEVVVPGLGYGAPKVAIPHRFVDRATEVPQAFRLVATYMTNDGLNDRIVEQKAMQVVVDEATTRQVDGCVTNPISFPGRNGEYLADPAVYPHLVSLSCGAAGANGAAWRSQGIAVYADDGFSMVVSDPDQPYFFSLPSAPQAMTRITLVDPAAEKALLGDAGAFLDPLVSVGASGGLASGDVATWAERQPASNEVASRIVEDTAAARAAETGWSGEALAEVRALYAAHGDDYDAWLAESSAETQPDRAIPLLATADAAAPLSVKIDVSALGDAPANLGTDSNRIGAGLYTLPPDAPGTPVGTTVADVSDLVNPFAVRVPGLTWPGADLELADELPDWSSLDIDRLLKPAPGTFDDTDGLALDASGFFSPQRSELTSDDWNAPASQLLRAAPERVGTESAYTGLADLWQRVEGDPMVTAIPVGSFDPDVIGLDPDAADYVPLGAYSPVGSTLADGPDAGTTMAPSLSGLGLVSPRTVAIGSIESAAIWGDERPISAIRVRVGGIHGYTPDAQAKVIGVAQAIELLGFEASVVAGSSPTDADVRIDGYAFGTSDPAGAQTVGGLGTVTQRWSELGAAARVELSVSTATLAVLGIALAAGVLLLGAVQVAEVPPRRAQAAVMREIGFTRGRIARWFALEELPGLVIVAVVAAFAWWISGGTGTAAVAGLGAAGAVLVLAIASVVVSSSTRRRPPRFAASRRLGARTVTGFGTRQASLHPLSTVVHVLAIVIVGLSVAAVGASLLTGQAEAGRSGRARHALGRQLVPQLALGATGIGAGVLLALLTRRIDLANRAEQWTTLRASGWTSGQLARAQRVEGLTIAVPAILVVAAAAWFGAIGLGLGHPAVLAAIAALGAAVTALIAFSTLRKGTA